MVIRLFRADDFPVVAAGLRDLVNIVADKDPFIPRIETQEEGDERLRGLQRFLESSEAGALFVAEHEGKVIGFTALFVRLPVASAYSHQEPVNVGVVQELWVDSSIRGQGTGRKLKQHAYTYLVRERDCAFMQLRALVANEDACKFYPRVGMTSRIVEFIEV